MSESEARIERIQKRLAGGMAKEFASRYSSSDVCNADVEWMLERISELEEENERLREERKGLISRHNAATLRASEASAENERLRATLEKKVQHLAEVRRGGEW